MTRYGNRGEGWPEKGIEEKGAGNNGIKKGVIKGVVAIAALITALNSVYVIDQREQGVVTQFGKPVKVILNPIKKDNKELLDLEEIKGLYEEEGIAVSEGAGLRVKIPFIQKVRRFDRRLLRWNGYPEEVPTKDKRYIWVDTTARWRIEDPLRFLRTMNSNVQALARLDDIIDSTTRNSITRRKLIEIVRTDNREMLVAEEELKETTGVEKIKEGRPEIVAEIISASKELVNEYGIKIEEMGVLIRGLTYVDSVKTEVEKRMIAERERIAEKYLSEGEGEFQKIIGDKEKTVKIILAEANKKAREIEGKADAEATKIYAEGFGKDPEFYGFWRKPELYDEFTKGKEGKTKLILGTDNPLFNLIKGELYPSHRTKEPSK